MAIKKEREAFLNVYVNYKGDSRKIQFNEETEQFMWRKNNVSDTEVEYVHLMNQRWYAWLACAKSKAQAVPEGFVLVEKKNTEDWYLDDCEGMWWNHDGIDGSLCELDIGEVQAVEHKEYLITENNTLYATRVWDDANDQVDCWQFFKTKEEAEKAAAYCKAKFYEEAQEPAND